MSETADTLRRAFDASFAVAPPEPVPFVDLLEIRVDAQIVALRVAELRSLHVAGRIVTFPGAPPELLGLAGVRGRVLPVFDLGALFGRAATTAPRWLAVTGSPAAALAFARFERQVRVPACSVVPSVAARQPGEAESASAFGAAAFVAAVVEIDRGTAGARTIPVVDLSAIGAELGRRARLEASGAR